MSGVRFSLEAHTQSREYLFETQKVSIHSWWEILIIVLALPLSGMKSVTVHEP